MDTYSVIVQFMKDGGIFIFPIAVVFAIGVAIAIERWFFLTRERIRNIKAFEDFLPLLRTADVEKMLHYSRESKAPIVRIIGCGLDMMKVTKNRGDVENAMSEGMLETMPRLEVRTGYLAVLANVATLLGLLGTIIGLISAFTAVASADPAEKSELLSRSISVAMNTTAAGLMAAIPLLVLHAMIQNKTTAIITSIEMAAVKFLNIMTINRLIEAGAPRTTPLGATPVQAAPQVAAVSPAATAAVASATVAGAAAPSAAPVMEAAKPRATFHVPEDTLPTEEEKAAALKAEEEANKSDDGSLDGEPKPA